MEPQETRRRLEAAIATARDRLLASRENEGAQLRAEVASGRDDERLALLPRIRALVAEVLLPLVRHRRHLLDEIGALRLGEEIWRRGDLPRIVLEYRSRLIAPEAPHSEMIFGFHPDGRVVLTWNVKSPLRHTATRLRRIEDLAPEVVAQEIDAFLAAAVLGHIAEQY